jgi:DNA-binding NarL/FixJ family response regulator
MHSACHPPPSAMYDVLIIDPEPMTRRGLALTLDAQPDLNVCADVSDAESALRALDHCEPDIVISEIALPNMNGLALIERLIEALPDLRIVMVSRQDSVVCAERTLRNGAHGYLVWRDKPEVFVQAIRHVVLGGRFISPRVTDDLFNAIAESTHPLIPSPVDVLSDREMELFSLVGDGLDVRMIAEKMGVSPKTVASYRARIKEKMNLRSNIELVRRAAQWCNGECVCYTVSGQPALTTLQQW